MSRSPRCIPQKYDKNSAHDSASTTAGFQDGSNSRQSLSRDPIFKLTICLLLSVLIVVTILMALFFGTMLGLG